MSPSLRAPTFGLACFMLLAAALTPAGAENTDVAHVLAPTGKLRAALYPGTPTSILPNPGGEARGVGYEIGKALADRLHVAYAPIVYNSNAEVQEAVKTGAADVAFTNASPARAKVMDFGPVYLRIELGYVVPEGSAVKDVSEIDSTGRRVAVTAHSSSDAELSRDLKNATLVRTATIKEAVDQLTAHQIDAFATNKATLFEMSEKVPGSHVLEGRWGEERHAIAIPKGREAGLAFLSGFTEEIQQSGLVKEAATRAGLKGMMTP